MCLRKLKNILITVLIIIFFIWEKAFAQTPEPPPGYIPTIVSGGSENPENFECPPDGELPLGYGEVEASDLWLELCAHCLPISTPLPPSATQTVQALTPEPTNTPDPNIRWVKCMSPMELCNPLMQEEPQFIVRAHQEKYNPENFWGNFYFEDVYIDYKVNPLMADDGYYEIKIDLDWTCEAGCLRTLSYNYKIIGTTIGHGDVLVDQGVILFDDETGIHTILTDQINYGTTYEFTNLHYYVYLYYASGIPQGNYKLNHEMLVSIDDEHVNWDYVESYCSRVHMPQEGGGMDDDAFSWAGIEFGAKYCVEVGPWEVDILGWVISVPEIAYLCAQDVSFGNVILFGLAVSIDVLITFLMVAWVVRNLFIS